MPQILVFRRTVRFAKEEWRTAGSYRTLETVDLSAAVQRVWAAVVRNQELQDCVVTIALETNQVTGKNFANAKKWGTGPFQISEGEPGEFKLRLVGETLGYGAPSRKSRNIAVLREWAPVRVILNGRFAGHHQTIYEVSDFHLLLTTEAEPGSLEVGKTIDLQEDLW